MEIHSRKEWPGLALFDLAYFSYKRGSLPPNLSPSSNNKHLNADIRPDTFSLRDFRDSQDKHSKPTSPSSKTIFTKMSGENTTPKFPEPTAKEAIFFYHIITSNKGKLEVDWNQVAEKSGYSNGATASVRYGQIKKRLGLTNEGSAPAAKSTPKPRAKKEIGSGTNTTPSKVTKKRTPKKSSKVTDAKLFGTVADDDEMLKGEQDVKGEGMGQGYGEGFEQIGYYDDEDDFYDESGAKNVHDDGSFV